VVGYQREPPKRLPTAVGASARCLPPQPEGTHVKIFWSEVAMVTNPVTILRALFIGNYEDLS
jgi:hypothetical protein